MGSVLGATAKNREAVDMALSKAKDIVNSTPVVVFRCMAKKPKPKMKPIELKTPPEQTQTITRTVFDILKDHGPLTIADTWQRLMEVGVTGVTSKSHMKTVLRWMRERQKLRLICNHVGPHKQFLYTTWFTKSNPDQARNRDESSQPRH